MLIISDIISEYIPKPNSPSIVIVSSFIIIPVVLIIVVAFILFNDINIEDKGPSK